ncbi:hypothetical protein F5Y00DRAFT_233277 [Daldinia vernicosa]|uniref:uncharacterized protein n=1 Tax=Daldinia vernicosa TaxID=114800 RepID=UPI002007CE03|nr:uncharacterized protein F5Y00DRAFT_233277 [Daldinia vernicosa]KAI0850418.1 hypothetical protein F5Y00DRAFT_233277 [Daldinia vernicosa]
MTRSIQILSASIQIAVWIQNFEKWSIKNSHLFQGGQGFASECTWVELYPVISTLIYRYNFQFQGAIAEDFECISDQFAIGTSGRGILNATVTTHER